MSLSSETPITIVGQGLAGSLLAWTLLQQGKDVHIFAGNKPSASRVAAGLINPVTGQRFVLAARTPEILSFAKPFYRHIEKTLNISFFHEKSMFRLFNSQKEQENCKKRQKNESYVGYFNDEKITPSLNQPHGGIVQRQTAWVDTNILLDALQKYFEKLNIITYGNFKAESVGKNIIYCEGFHMMTNPLFSWLPLQPAHGEIISCKSDKKLPDYIINQSRWLLPTSEHTCRIGATYETDKTTPVTQTKSKQQLLDFAHTLFTESHAFKVTQHQAGIRPTTLDKQPFIGFHPKHQTIAIFNGFGSRGCLMIPWYTQQFSQQSIPAQADIQRYAHLCV